MYNNLSGYKKPSGYKKLSGFNRRFGFYKLAGLLLAVMLLQSCATPLNPKFEEPTVTVNSFNVLPSSSLTPKFEIGLHIVNPNSVALKLRGLTYTASVEGQQLLTGASSDLPEIAAYSEGDVKLTASPNLVGGLKLLGKLMNKPSGSVGYDLSLKLDVGSLLPAIRVNRSGKIGIPGN